MKAVCCGMVALFLCLTLSGNGKDQATLLCVLGCCMILSVAAAYLEPVIRFFEELEEMIPLESEILGILLKIVGIGILGELAAAICCDSGRGALGKAIQALTGITLLWLTLPMLQTLLDLIRQILEVI